jgi:hypothetical protein
VEALGASTFEGRDRKAWEAKSLADLGAAVKHRQQTMPLKMLQGVRKAQREREKKREEGAKAAGLVLPGKKADKGRERRRFGGGGGGSDDDDPTPNNIRGPVMYLGGRKHGGRGGGGGGGGRGGGGGGRGGRR